jgi:hypothetical protein
VRWMAEETQQGELLGIPPTGKQARSSSLASSAWPRGKIAEQWEEWDKLDLMRQLGVMPSPEQGKPQPRSGVSDARWGDCGSDRRSWLPLQGKES